MILHAFTHSCLSGPSPTPEAAPSRASAHEAEVPTTVSRWKGWVEVSDEYVPVSDRFVEKIQILSSRTRSGAL
jgi:hypothetical protein